MVGLDPQSGEGAIVGVYLDQRMEIFDEAANRFAIGGTEGARHPAVYAGRG
jgi:hypothetical protein